MDTPLLLNCTIRAIGGAFALGRARFSVSGNSPNAQVSYGPWDEATGRFAIADRLVGCNIQERSDGSLLVTGTSREAVRLKGASDAEARVTIEVTPGSTPGLDVEVEEP